MLPEGGQPDLSLVTIRQNRAIVAPLFHAIFAACGMRTGTRLPKVESRNVRPATT
jgi:hypothetical protein